MVKGSFLPVVKRPTKVIYTVGFTSRTRDQDGPRTLWGSFPHLDSFSLLYVREYEWP